MIVISEAMVIRQNRVIELSSRYVGPALNICWPYCWDTVLRPKAPVIEWLTDTLYGDRKVHTPYAGGLTYTVRFLFCARKFAAPQDKF